MEKIIKLLNELKREVKREPNIISIYHNMCRNRYEIFIDLPVFKAMFDEYDYEKEIAPQFIYHHYVKMIDGVAITAQEAEEIKE